MARYCQHDLSPVLDAAERWRDSCLIQDGSVLSSQSIWTPEGLDELHTYFVDNPDEGDRDFLDKLKDQLAPAKPETRRLAAEVLWLLYLFPRPSAIGPEKKREQIQRVWSWGGDDLAAETPALLAPLATGVGNPGTAYNTRRWAEFAFVAELARRLKTLPIDDRRALLSEPWRFASWSDAVMLDGRPQSRHILRFLLFPDQFERSSTGRDKRRILAAFRSLPLKEVRALPFAKVDEELFKLRAELQTELGTDALDFYLPPLVDRWRTDDSSDVGYWKIAPGEGARLWEKCYAGGFIAIGWDELGDLSGLTRAEFDTRVAQQLEAHPDWDKTRLEQLWKLVNIRKGDRIVANRGTSEVLGIGTVDGPYYFVAGEEYGHRLPVEWEDVEPRKVDEPGWRRTLIKLSPAKFEHIQSIGFSPGSESAHSSGANPVNLPSNWLFQTNPRLFDIDGALHDLDEIAWLVKQHRQHIKPGHRVFVWRSGTNAGVVGQLEVISETALLTMPDHEQKYSHATEKFDGELPRVRCRVIRRLADPISKAAVLADPILSEIPVLKAPQGTNYALTEAQAARLGELMESAIPPTVSLNPMYGAHDFAAETGFPASLAEHWLAQLKRKKHFVFQGPPGTGKTFLAEKLGRMLLSGSRGVRDTVQFHPSYAYEDFMQGIRPEVVKGQLAFQLVPGRFLDFCRRAAALPSTEPCVMIIDELNRANLSRVFGELMYLLEYRDREVPLASGGQRFHVPENVFVLGTMNTADRSIALVDHALRRRFTFVFLGPEYQVLEKRVASLGLPAASLVGALKQVNSVIGDRNYELGISFFMNDGASLRKNLSAIWRGEVEPYLEEYFFDQPERVAPLRWEKLSESTLADWL
jgi:hypothetical protein